MPNVTGAIRPWRGDRWSLRISLAIEGRLQRRRDRIAKLLEIDPSEHEWRSRPAPSPSGRNLPRNKAYIEWRKAPSAGGADISRIDLAIEEIAGELRRYWAIHRNVMRAGSTAAVYRDLERLHTRCAFMAEQFEACSPHVRFLVAEFYPGGWIALETSEPDPKVLDEAVKKALASLPQPKPGRPKDTKNVASDVLARALADIYHRYSSKRPTRRRRGEGLDATEYGPFKDFVAVIISVIPSRLRRSRKGGLKSVDHLVRTGVGHLRDTRSP